LDRKALRAKGVSYSNVHLLRLEAQGKFPPRFNLTENRVAWLEEDVDRWIRERVTASSRRTADALAGGGNARPAA
jgi:predicted DNA-binding transcriptional regulator AlpA